MTLPVPRDVPVKPRVLWDSGLGLWVVIWAAPWRVEMASFETWEQAISVALWRSAP